MSTTITPTAATLPQGFCPSTEQERLDEYAESLSITIGDYYGQFVISGTTPSSGDQDKVWLKLDGGGSPIGFFYYVGGVWTQIDPPNVWVATGGGSINAYTITVSNYPSTTGPRTNDVFFFSIPALQSNTAASTLNLNSTGAKNLKSANGDLWNRALEEKKWYSAVYDGTNFEVTAVKQIDEGDIPAGDEGAIMRTRDVSGTLTTVWENPYVGEEQSIPTAGNKKTWAHLLTTTPIAYQIRFRCKTAEFGYVADDEVDVMCAFFADGHDDTQFGTYANSSDVGLIRPNTGATINFWDKGTGASSAMTEANWRVVAYAIR